VGDRLHVDLTGPHPPSRQDSVYILTAVDAYSRYLICKPLKNKSALSLASALVEHVFLPHGSYRALVSDQGREFCNELLESITTLLGIRKLPTTAYRPAAKRRIELFIVRSMVCCKINCHLSQLHITQLNIPVQVMQHISFYMAENIVHLWI